MIQNMPRFFRSTVLLAILILAGCSDTEKQGPTAKSEATAGEFKPPVKGETMAQVKAKFDDPMRVESNSDGTQTWVYILGKGKLFIPYYGAFAKTTILVINFDPAGNVATWKTSEQRAL
jgi:hypothetical protein